MDWLQVLVLFTANAGLILWFRSESREDWKHMDQKMDKMDSEFKEFRELWRQESNRFYEKWHQESKDFHEKLIKIETRRK